MGLIRSKPQKVLEVTDRVQGQQPYRRCSRPNRNGDYSIDYMPYENYAKDGSLYIQSAKIIEQDYVKLCEYIYPTNANLSCFSARVEMLLQRTCLEIEGNLRAILIENEYASHDARLDMRDYSKVEQSHCLSAYSAVYVNWHEKDRLIYPFANWAKNGSLPWWHAYTALKHRKYEKFSNANFGILTESVAALAIVIASQFQNFEYAPFYYTLSVGEFMADDRKPSAGGALRISYPKPDDFSETYDFDKSEIEDSTDYFRAFRYV